MKRPDEVRREFVRQWLAKALGDLKIARHLLGGGAELARGAAFHSQQAAEKYLKAVLVWHQVEFAKIHDIARLIDQVRPVDPALADAVREAAVLTPYGVEVRYPGDEPEPTPKEAQAAVALAESVRDAVIRSLPAEFAVIVRRD
jgi:HEPN domain-containing protein